MCINAVYYLVCTDCRKMFYDEMQNGHFESREEVIEEATASGWHCQVLVPNGSKWDFCPSCYEVYQQEKED